MKLLLKQTTIIFPHGWKKSATDVVNSNSYTLKEFKTLSLQVTFESWKQNLNPVLRIKNSCSFASCQRGPKHSHSQILPVRPPHKQVPCWKVIHPTFRAGEGHSLFEGWNIRCMVFRRVTGRHNNLLTNPWMNEWMHSGRSLDAKLKGLFFLKNYVGAPRQHSQELHAASWVWICPFLTADTVETSRGLPITVLAPG